jgi:NAD(P)-dependent dehydrogenase (short-subunit alcohol dehydrogenase family)
VSIFSQLYFDHNSKGGLALHEQDNHVGAKFRRDDIGKFRRSCPHIGEIWKHETKRISQQCWCEPWLIPKQLEQNLMLLRRHAHAFARDWPMAFCKKTRLSSETNRPFGQLRLCFGHGRGRRDLFARDSFTRSIQRCSKSFEPRFRIVLLKEITMKLSHRVVAITGAGSGIGRALALRLAQKTCRLALSDIDEARLDETRRLLASVGVAGAERVATTKVDTASRSEVLSWAKATARHFGEVHLVVNNAGVAQAGTVEANRYEDYEWVMSINFWGVVYGTKEFLPILKASGEGHIVNISSVFGLFAQPTQSAYNASKFAVRGFTESLRQELDLERCGVSATCVHPGGIKTNIAKAARVGGSVTHLLGASEADAIGGMEKMFRTSPELAANAIIRGVERNARRVLIGADAYGIDAVQRCLPTAYQAIVGKLISVQKKM